MTTSVNTDVRLALTVIRPRSVHHFLRRSAYSAAMLRVTVKMTLLPSPGMGVSRNDMDPQMLLYMLRNSWDA
jgi:hypothetical protein